jgi:hypothetical protein
MGSKAVTKPRQLSSSSNGFLQTVLVNEMPPNDVATGIGGQTAGWDANLIWVSFIVEEDVALDPIDAGAFGAD